MKRYVVLALLIPLIAVTVSLLRSLQQQPACYEQIGIAWAVGLLLGTLIAVIVLGEERK